MKYTVQRGDTLGFIATKITGDPVFWDEIPPLNPGMNPNVLQVGQIINIPDDWQTFITMREQSAALATMAPHVPITEANIPDEPSNSASGATTASKPLPSSQSTVVRLSQAPSFKLPAINMNTIYIASAVIITGIAAYLLFMRKPAY